MFELLRASVTFFLLATFWLSPFSIVSESGGLQAATVSAVPKKNYPLLANYYLEPTIPPEDQDRLADFDVVILDMEAQHNYRALFDQLRAKNPRIKIFAYVPVQHASVVRLNDPKYILRSEILKRISDVWYLKDSGGRRISISPGAELVNMTTEWKDFLPQFVKDKILSTGLWDGIFFDGIEERISWVNNGDIDIDSNRFRDELDEADWWWKNDTIKFLQNARDKLGSKTLLIANTRDFYAPYLNGVLFENFANWPGYFWPENFARYQRAVQRTQEPHLVIVNGNSADTGFMEDYRRVRWGLTTTLLSDGYFSFDFGPTKHGQTWRYDEYRTQLGQPHGPAYKVFGGDRVDHETFTDGMDRHYRYRENEQTPYLAQRISAPEAINGFSILGSALPGKKWNEFLRSDPDLLPLRSLAGYQVKFKYKVLESSRSGYFYFGARSLSVPDQAQQQLASWNGASGQTGEVTALFTPTGSDHYLFYGIKYDGAIVIDDIEIVELSNTVWRRDFEKGSVFVNASYDVVNLNLERVYNRLAGVQDFLVNTGEPITLLSFAPEDGTILLRPKQILAQPTKKSALATRILDYRGNRLGAVDYKIKEKRTWVVDLNSDGFKETVSLVTVRGHDKIRITSSKGRLLLPLVAPFGAKGGRINLTVADLDGDAMSELIVSSQSGPSLIKILDKDGRERDSFLAFDNDEYYGGVRVEVQE